MSANEEPRLPEIHLPRWAKLAIALPAIGLPVGILLFILRNDYAHDETRCPYQVIETRALNADIHVIEERRSCIDGIEDRRYSAKREDAVHILGTRRLPTGAFATPAYHWSAEIKDEQVRLVVHAAGEHPKAEFREGTAQERGE